MHFLNQHAVWAHGPFFAYTLIALIDTHITTTCVTLYLHRAQTHRSIKFHPVIEHLMRLWLWMRTAMPTQEWVAVHRCHHAHVDAEGDPHSPIFFGIWRVVLLGTKLYHDSAKDPAVIEQFGKGTPHDAIEHLYSGVSLLGPVVTLVTNVLAVRRVGHRHVAGRDGVDSVFRRRRHQRPRPLVGLPELSRRPMSRAKNLPGQVWSLLTCGEALHNNHHHVQNSPRFSVKRGEIDLGYFYYSILRGLGLATELHERHAA